MAPKFNTDSGITSKVTEAWSLEDFYIKINGVEVCDADLTGFECIYGGCNLPAQIQFIDSKGITTGDVSSAANIGVGGIVEVGYTTPTNCDFRDDFVIKKVSTQNNSKNQKLVTLELEDLETRNMKGSYVNKGYPDKKFSEVVESHDKEIKNDKLRGKKKLSIIPPENEKPVNIVIPSSIDYYTWLTTEMNDKGFSYIKDKSINYLIHTSNRVFDKLSNLGDVFEYDAESPFSFSRIVQFNVEGFDMDAYLESIPTSFTSIDLVTQNSKENKDKIDSKMSQKDPKENVKTKTSGVAVGDLAILSRGKKTGQKEIKDQQYFEAISNAQKMSIWVPGRTDNMIGRKITVNLPKPSYYIGDDKIFSGEWEVYMSRDKIIGAYFMQELFLRRPGGTNK